MKRVEKIYSTDGAFAVLVLDGTVVTWGDKRYGGDSRNVQVALGRVDKIYSTLSAFAEVEEIGTVVTWGEQRYGGDSKSVQVICRRDEKIYSTGFAFAAAFGGKLTMKAGPVVT